MKPVEPIMTLELFPPLSQELQAILRALHPTDWARPTICASWIVKDVAAHLLGGNLSRLWKRDELVTAPLIPVLDYEDLVSKIDQDNDLWVQAVRRISPEILVELVDFTDRRLSDHFRRLAPYEPAGVAVAWAGESVSPNWFDMAREYTEKWLHQQHIREAVGQPLLVGRQWLFPVLDTFMRGLPYTYRNIQASDGTRVTIQITGEAGGAWTLESVSGAWRLLGGRDPNAASCVQMDQDLAWRIFTKGVPREAAQGQVQIGGDQILGSQVLSLVSIMA